LSSVYSDNAKTITNVTLAGTTPIGVVQGSGEIVEAPRFDYQTKTIAFGNQIRNNFGQSFGATLSVPIYNKLQNHTQISKSELAITQAELNALRIKQNVYNDVSNAYFGFENAKAQYLGQKQNYEAQKQNLEFVQLRYSAGQSTPFELQLAINSEVSAFQNFLAAKYELILRELILDVMLTNNIELSIAHLIGNK
jgi:outer membrane protein